MAVLKSATARMCVNAINIIAINALTGGGCGGVFFDCPLGRHLVEKCKCKFTLWGLDEGQQDMGCVETMCDDNLHEYLR